MVIKSYIVYSVLASAGKSSVFGNKMVISVPPPSRALNLSSPSSASQTLNAKGNANTGAKPFSCWRTNSARVWLKGHPRATV